MKKQIALRRDECRSSDTRNDLARRTIQQAVGSFETGAENSFLARGLAWSQPPLRREASQFGAGAGSAGRAVVGLAGTQHEVSAVDSHHSAGNRQLHMIDLFPLCSGD